MDHTSAFTLPGLELEVGPHALPVRLRTSAQLRVEFTHNDAVPAILTLPNGDPGEPGEPEYFDFKTITTPHPLVLTSSDNHGRFVIEAGDDMFKYLSDDEVADIEHAMLAQLRARKDERLLDRLDDLMLPRLAAMGLGARS